ncbi:zinc ABC transporter substrate-binding protein [Lutimaribacter sp. EGI FJ00015]|uniref:Zinc ABC transporter substrate-binding protein n=1 Tax=Lutimaribacter degradans TaxID=2945989 RepID=A0ACC5ZU06_9RHOB|nr:zinc ABC transporter substrate-binding protein [Lutimaribacter sp. EGI FJ00013]MCM2561806.1 zinc ABC transporter substrate-binding protein [Lutimaribacter sp. EGI FJ00013]MCO0613161.1 zinc ABC transporter substrate-binding protein [Lutimaribacter sp. EGI FJ00015]MCO0635639.1 zinc ABC transporter substrate-binding protein [Lutimaribacter sp. EGI FJ00014]
MIRPALAALLLTSTAAFADTPSVTADIAPIHSLVAQVMGDLGQPDLLVRPGASPHGYSLRPSEARALDDADLVVMVGERLTPWLMQPVETLAGQAHVVQLLDAPGTTLLEKRAGTMFERHDHADDADDHDHSDHAAKNDHGHDDDVHGAHQDAHDDTSLDPHAWLDPQNGAAWLEAIAAELSELDPDNAATYRANATAGMERLAALEAEITDSLPEGRSGFVVFHDAYQYFENRFGLSAAGSISLSDATAPSAGRVSELREKIKDLRVTCIFTEPQFDPGIIAALDVDGLSTASLDPMGTTANEGPDLYPQTLRAMGTAFATCLGGQD